MGRQRDPKRDEAYKLWKDSKGVLKLKDIAERLGVSDTQIRKWKNQDDWENGNKGTLLKTNRNVTKTKSNVTNDKKNEDKPDKTTPIVEYTEPENDDLTDKQRLFCLYYVKYWNAGKAAQRAGYEYSYPNGFYEMGSQLRKKPQVRREIDRLKKSIVDGIEFEAMAVFQKYIDIAFSDITDYVEFGEKEEQAVGEEGEPIIDPTTGAPLMYKRNYVSFKNSVEVDGTLISEVKQGKDGVSVKLHDKMKALEFLTKYYDLLPDHHKRKIDEEKLKMDKERLEIERSKIKKDDEEEGKTIKVSLPNDFDEEI